MESNQGFVTIAEIVNELEQKMLEFEAGSKEQIIKFYQALHASAVEYKRTFPGGEPLTEEDQIMLTIFCVKTNNAFIDFGKILAESTRECLEISINKFPEEIITPFLEEIGTVTSLISKLFTLRIKEIFKKCHTEYNQYLKENGFLNVIGYRIEVEIETVDDPTNFFQFGEGLSVVLLHVLDKGNETHTTIELCVVIEDEGKGLDLQKGGMCIAETSDIKKLEKLLGKERRALQEYLLEPILFLLNPGGKPNTETLTLASELKMKCILRRSHEASYEAVEQAALQQR